MRVALTGRASSHCSFAARCASDEEGAPPIWPTPPHSAAGRAAACCARTAAPPSQPPAARMRPNTPEYAPHCPQVSALCASRSTRCCSWVVRADRTEYVGVRIHIQQGPHHLGACRFDRGRIGCGLHRCEWCRPSRPPLAVLTPMASMPPIYIRPGGGEGIHHASRHPPPSGGPALTGWRDTSTFKGAYSES